MFDQALEELQRGAAIVVPTDTVYGLAALPENPDAVRWVFELKRRPDHKSLPVLASSARVLDDVVEMGPQAQRLAEVFWPGPLTLVLPRADGFDHDLGAGTSSTVAVRVPAHEVALALLERAGPLAVTSANLSGEPAATTTAEAREAFGDAIPVYLEGGTCAGGASTVVELGEEVSVLRSGPVSEDEIRRTLDP